LEMGMETRRGGDGDVPAAQSVFDEVSPCLGEIEKVFVG
jgi:hypothetical protein